MTEPILTSLYAAPLALMYIVLAARVVNLRTSERVSLGTGESEALLRATRIHGNFSEYVPFTLLLMALAEMGGAWPWLIHGLGLALIAGRLLHAYSIPRGMKALRFRVAGMALTFAALAAGAVASAAFALF
ncbi:MAG: MAPEG family protein [Rhodobiaceae bacterium]|nr:MAPEG family protein [Rhodobiaceae bacterium]